MKDMAKK